MHGQSVANLSRSCSHTNTHQAPSALSALLPCLLHHHSFFLGDIEKHRSSKTKLKTSSDFFKHNKRNSILISRLRSTASDPSNASLSKRILYVCNHSTSDGLLYSHSLPSIRTCTKVRSGSGFHKSVNHKKRVESIRYFCMKSQFFRLFYLEPFMHPCNM